MTKPTRDDLAAAVLRLVDEDEAKSETARLREIFDEIEMALSSGVKQKALLAVLHEKGFTMTMAGFKTALQRIRKERSVT